MSATIIPITPPDPAQAAREIAEIIRHLIPITRLNLADDLLESQCRAFIESLRETEASV